MISVNGSGNPTAVSFTGTAVDAASGSKKQYTSFSPQEVVVDGKTWWAKPYVLNISIGTGVASVTVRRTASKEPSASLTTLSNGSTVYWGDTLTVSATAASGYTLQESYPYTMIVNGNTEITVTAKAVLQKLKVSFSTLYIESRTTYSTTFRAEFRITNPNDVSVEITDLVGYVTTKETSAKDYNAGGFGSSGTLKLPYRLGKVGTINNNIKVTCTAKAASRYLDRYLYSAFVSVRANNDASLRTVETYYNPDYVPDETTTTTTTPQGDEAYFIAETAGDWQLFEACEKPIDKEKEQNEDVE